MDEEQKEQEQNPGRKNGRIAPQFPEDSHAPVTTQLQTKNMELVAEHLHEAPGHGWKHYVFEFLMLFLAVFCGFLAENEREKLAEHRSEVRYMQNLLQDLVRDTLHIQSQLVFQQRAVRYADSLVYLMHVPDRNKYLNNAYYYTRILAILNPFLYSNATVTQLKNSGSFRLIKKEYVADSIVQYDVWAQRILKNDDNIQNLIGDFRSTAGYVFDAQLIGEISNNILIGNNGSGAFVERPSQALPLVTEDRKTINQLCLYADFLASLYQSHFNSLSAQKERGIRLMQLLKKEYHLK